MMENGFPKRLPGAWADAMKDEPDAWTEQAAEFLEEDGPKTKWSGSAELRSTTTHTRNTPAPKKASGRPMTSAASSSAPAKSGRLATKKLSS